MSSTRRSLPAVGIHVPISKGVNLAVDRAIEIGCVGVFQIFTCSPRRWDAPELKPDLAAEFRRSAKNHGFLSVAHMPYMPNLSSPDDKFYKQSVDVAVRETRRCAELGIEYLVLHFGSRMGSPIEEAHGRVIHACKKTIEATEKVRLLLETSAGTKNSVGSRFEYLRKVIDGIGRPDRIGICFDTCHVFASGYDLRSKENVQETMEEFDRAVGISNLYLIHLNDSKEGLGEGKDRHEHIGLGQIGAEGLKALLVQDNLRHIPFVLETPIDDIRDDSQNVAYTKKLAGIK